MVFLYFFEARIDTSISSFSGTFFTHTLFVSPFHKFVVSQAAGTNFWRFRMTFLHSS